jgi:hypothetical protein
MNHFSQNAGKVLNIKPIQVKPALMYDHSWDKSKLSLFQRCSYFRVYLDICSVLVFDTRGFMQKSGLQELGRDCR